MPISKCTWQSIAFGCLFPTIVAAQAGGPSVLFVRGADGSGGLGSNSTEHLSDIDNNNTANGNHGFGQFAALLRSNGFQVSQWIESDGRLDVARLAPHDAVVMGSNNRTYDAAEVAALHAYIDAGGAGLFMSDANWGGNFAEAPNSDNLFLVRFGLEMLQDTGGGVATMRRSETGRYLIPQNPILDGLDGMDSSDDIGTFSGEGVSFIRILAPTAGSYRTESLVSALGFRVRENTTGSTGSLQPATTAESPLCVSSDPSTGGRVVCFFDRNTFFNQGGVGGNLFQNDHQQLALNLFRYLVAGPPNVTPIGRSCSASGNLTLSAVTEPAIGRSMDYRVDGAAPGSMTAAVFAGGPPVALGIGGCELLADSMRLIDRPGPTTDATGSGAGTLPIPPILELSGLQIVFQVVIQAPGGPLLGFGELSHALDLRLGL